MVEALFLPWADVGGASGSSGLKTRLNNNQAPTGFFLFNFQKIRLLLYFFFPLKFNRKNFAVAECSCEFDVDAVHVGGRQ